MEAVNVPEEEPHLLDHVLADPLAMVEPVAVRIGSHEIDVVQLHPAEGKGTKKLLRLPSCELRPHLLPDLPEFGQLPRPDTLEKIG